MQTLFGSLSTVIAVGGYLIAGILYVLGLLDKQRKEREQADDQTATRLIANLKTTVDLQESEMKRMSEQMEIHTKERDTQIRELSDKVVHMQGRNAVLEDLFKGRDPAMQVFLKGAPELIQIARENNGLAKENAQALTHLTTVMADFIESMKNA